MVTQLRRLTAFFAALPPGVRGMVFMLISTFCVVGMNVTVRQIAGQIHVFEIAFFRNLFGVLVFAPLFLKARVNPLRTSRVGLLTLRAALNIVAMFAYFTGLTMIPLAEVTALSFTSPLFATVLAVLILGEVMGVQRWVGLGVGLIGALIILRPGVAEIGLGPMLILSSTAVWAFALICIKVLSRTESSLTIAVYAALMQVPMAFIAALFVWQWPTVEQLMAMALIGAFGATAQYCIAQSFREADATLVLPVDFSKLVWASIAGYLFFGEIPDLWSWTGGFVVFAAVFFMAYRERRK